MRQAWLLAAAAVLVASLPAATAPGTAAVVPFSIVVDGEVATGLLGVPAKGTSDVLVVMCHGLGGSAAGFANELRAVAERHWLGVAMDYRGPRGTYNVLNGTADTLAATRFLQAQHPIESTVVWGNSMGGHVSGLAVIAGPGLYDIWVDSVGVANWAEAWALASLLGRGELIAQDAGGTPLEVPMAYVEGSPALHPTGFLDSGLDRAYLVYGSADTTVPSSHGHELAANLARQGVPVSMYTAVRSMDLAQPGHLRYGFDIVLAKAGGVPGSPLPFVEGIFDLSSGTYAPPP